MLCSLYTTVNPGTTIALYHCELFFDKGDMRSVLFETHHHITRVVILRLIDPINFLLKKKGVVLRHSKVQGAFEIECKVEGHKLNIDLRKRAAHG